MGRLSHLTRVVATSKAVETIEWRFSDWESTIPSRDELSSQIALSIVGPPAWREVAGKKMQAYVRRTIDWL